MGLCLHVFGPGNGEDEEPEEIAECDVGHYSDFGCFRDTIARHLDARSDVYSLGAVAFFALGGRPPFQGKTLGQLLAAHRSEPPPRLTDLRPDVPADLAAVVVRCLAKDPADRFSSAADLDRVLKQCPCAADWSAEQAAEWWQVKTGGGKISGPNKRMQLTGPA